MAQRTHTCRAIVIKKTKLGESDLILTLLAEDGQQVRAVAKGARKPTSPFASRLELFSCADTLIAKGRSLDVISEARLVEGNELLRRDYDLCIAASPMAELLCRITESGLTSERLFPLTHATFSALCSAGRDSAPLICSAFLLKALSFSGFKPSLDACVSCGQTVGSEAPEFVSLSYAEGGVVCSKCSHDVECVRIERRLVEWIHILLYSRYDDIVSYRCDGRNEFQLLQFCQQWTRYHVGTQLKSLTFLLSQGAF